MDAESKSASDAQSLTGTQLGKYQLRSVIGRGGMGTVYEAYDTTLDRLVALKVMAPHLAWQEGFVERFLREARAAAQLRHPSIVTIYDVGRSNDWYYFAMDYVKGRTLAQIIQQQGPTSVQAALRVLRPLAAALDYAHGRGVIHRDIKPSNVIVGDAGDVTLTDFGIARATAASRLTRTGMVIGTPEYMAPEQASGGDVGPPSDQYALGVIAYEMLAGRAPFEAESTATLLYKIVNEAPPSLAEARPDLPGTVESVLARALAKQPENRFSTCGAFLHALEEAVWPAPEVVSPEGLAATSRPSGPVDEADSRTARSPRDRPSPVLLGLGGVALAIIGVLCLVVVGVGAVIALNRAADRERAVISPTDAPASLAPTPSTLPQPTMTVETPPSAPVVPTDPPASGYGPVLYQDSFEDPDSGWEVGDYDGGSVGYRDGRYSVIAAGEFDWMWGVAYQFFTDLVVEVDATQVLAGPDNDNDYGVGCRIQPNGDGYHLIISGDGFYAIYMRQDGLFIPLVPFETSAAVRRGDTTNRITVVCVGPTLTLLVNGQELATAVDDTFVAGDIALSATSYEDAPTEILFDNLVVYAPSD